MPPKAQPNSQSAQSAGKQTGRDAAAAVSAADAKVDVQLITTTIKMERNLRVLGEFLKKDSVRKSLDPIHVSTLLNNLSKTYKRDKDYHVLVELALTEARLKIPKANAQSIANMFNAIPKLGVDLHRHADLIAALFNRAAEVMNDFKMLEIANLLNALPRLGTNLYLYRSVIIGFFQRIKNEINGLNILDLSNIIVVLPKVGIDVLSCPDLIDVIYFP